jgi:hypothetical protein
VLDLNGKEAELTNAVALLFAKLAFGQLASGWFFIKSVPAPAHLKVCVTGPSNPANEEEPRPTSDPPCASALSVVGPELPS